MREIWWETGLKQRNPLLCVAKMERKRNGLKHEKAVKAVIEREPSTFMRIDTFDHPLVAPECSKRIDKLPSIGHFEGGWVFQRIGRARLRTEGR